VTIQSRCLAALFTTGSLVFLAGCGGPSATPQGGGSGTQTRAVIDVLKLEESGLIQPGWQQELPNNGIITNSAVAFLTRAGNPKQITTWKDLVKPGGTPQQAEAYVTSVYKNVDNLPKDAREASDVFLKRHQGDVLLNYENEAILATKTGDLKGTRKAAEALAAYLVSDEAQLVFAEEGFRPTSPTVWVRVKDRFAPVKTFFSVKDFGGWSQVNMEFFDNGGIWDRLFANTR
jgi:sulfate transport system substrate-binding protein